MKIPPHAKRVFKGVIFDVYQWDQEMFDGTTETFEMIKRPHTIQIIATQGDKILISREEQPHKGPFYGLFGGRGEEGEEPLVTAKRELLEETGLASEDWELWKVYEPLTKIDWQIYFYIARDCRKVTKQHLDPGEKIEIKEVTLNEFFAIVDSTEFRATEIAHDVAKIKRDEHALRNFKQKLFTTEK